MIRNLIIITLVALSVGCYQKPKRNVMDANLQKVMIDFAHISISIPKYFKRYSPEDLTYAIQNSDSSEFSENEKQEQIFRIERFRLNSLGMMYYIYVDTANIDNVIIFKKTKYIKLSKEVRQDILSTTEKNLSPFENQFELRRLDTQFFTGEKAQILKQKFSIEWPGGINYKTFYFVTTRSNTFQILVERSDNEDYENRVTGMRVGL